LLGGLGIKDININSNEDWKTYRHSTSHIMAHAVKELFPDAKLAIGLQQMKVFIMILIWTGLLYQKTSLR
jgi:hypothetical protein